MARLQGRLGPGPAHVLDQGLGPVLHQQVDGVDLGIDEIAEDEIDDAITSAERNGGLGTVRSQRVEPSALPSGHDHRENTRDAHSAPVARAPDFTAEGAAPRAARAKSGP